MKFIRNGRIRDRIIDTVAKGLLIAFSALVCLWMISGARAAGIDIQDIKQRGAEDGGYTVEFVLSRAIEKGDVAVDFQRNFIQVSLKGVSAFPARTERLKHDLMDKVFTYQYQPDMARARVLLKGQASGVKDSSTWEIDGQTVRITVRGEKGNVAASEKDKVKTRAAATSTAETAVSSIDAEEQKMREEILKGAESPRTAEAPAAAKAKTVDSESLPIFTGSTKTAATGMKDKESPAAKIFASLLLVVGVIGAGALAFRRFVQGKGVGFQRQGKMIHVIANQTLGPKRSIALVKVLDQHMVVGMSGDGMTLLANLGSEVNIDKYEDFGIGASFTDTLQGAISGGNVKGTNTGSISDKGSDVSFRASLKKRLEGFKPL